MNNIDRRKRMTITTDVNDPTIAFSTHEAVVNGTKTINMTGVVNTNKTIAGEKEEATMSMRAGTKKTTITDTTVVNHVESDRMTTIHYCGFPDLLNHQYVTFRAQCLWCTKAFGIIDGHQKNE